MLKILYTADIHIVIKKDIPEQWQLNRYYELFRLLTDACVREKATLTIAGDLFEKASPTLQEFELAFLFFDMLYKEGIQVTLIGGNHETIEKDKCTFSYLDKAFPNNVAFYTKYCVLYTDPQIVFHYISHCALNLPVDLPLGQRNILVTHFRTNLTEHIREEIDTVSLCAPYNLVIAGDIHTEYTKDNLVYTNCPMNTSFGNNINTGYIILEVNEESIEYRRVKTDLPKLIKITCNSLEEYDNLPLNDRDYYRIDLTGTLLELRSAQIKQPNVKVVKIPLVHEVPETFIQEEDIQETDIGKQFVDYFKKIPYNEEVIDKLMNIWKEVL